jgi:hypothetical protein
MKSHRLKVLIIINQLEVEYDLDASTDKFWLEK